MFKKCKENGLNEQLGNLNREMTTTENKSSSVQNHNKLSERVTRWVKADAINVRRKNQSF